MKTLLCLSVIMLLCSTAADARHRTHVVIHKEAPSQTPVSVAVAAIPVFGMFYDLARRTNCDGDVLGLGGPGFDSAITPVTGNVMTTAYMRGECPGVAPRR
jgi:hypothetical protein